MVSSVVAPLEFEFREAGRISNKAIDITILILLVNSTVPKLLDCELSLSISKL
jgi:hypothetical protein